MDRNATLRIDRGNSIAPIDGRLFGSFIEHLGRAVYTGIYEPGHPTADAQGFREDVAQLVRELGVPVVRYPGGNFVSGYDWEDGIGPPESRPARLDLAWTAVETNRVGLDEFVDWAKKVGSETMMAVNLGTRGPDQARRIVEYCNHPSGTALSDARAANGHPEPHGIRLWCLGNEMDGPWQIGAKTAEEYGRVACEAAKVMKWVDPTIELVACGSSSPGMSTFGAWEETVLRHTYKHVEYLSLHSYYGDYTRNSADHLAQGVVMSRFIDDVVRICDRIKEEKKGTKDIMLSFDEWNVWYHSNEKDKSVPRWLEVRPLLEDEYDFQDALLVGSLLMTLLNHSDRVKIACLAQLVNVIAPIMTEPGGGVLKQTTYHPFALTSRYGRGTALRVDVDSPTYACAYGTDVPLLDTAATVSDDGTELVLFLMNRGLEEGIEVTADLAGFRIGGVIEHVALEGHGLSDVNTFESPDHVSPVRVDRTEVLPDGRVRISLEKASWSMVRLQLVP